MSTTQDVDEQIQQAASAQQAGDHQRAVDILKQLVEVDPRNEQVWWLLAQTTQDKLYQRYCLKRLQDINPDHPEANALLETMSRPSELTASPTQTAPGAPSPTHRQASIEVYQPQKWEHLFAEFALTDRGYTLIAVNGSTRRHRMDLEDYSNHMGEQGWQLVSSQTVRRVIPKNSLSLADLFQGTTNNVIDALMLMFKRPI